VSDRLEPGLLTVLLLLLEPVEGLSEALLLLLSSELRDALLNVALLLLALLKVVRDVSELLFHGLPFAGCA